MLCLVTHCRDRASTSLPGTGLAMCGVGYDLDDLAVDKFVSRRKQESATNKRSKVSVQGV